MSADTAELKPRGMVTSPNVLASETGLAVLRQGGNAIEAAIAIGAVLAVTCPHFCGLGGDAVWLVADPDGRQTSFLGIGQAAQNSAGIEALPVRGPLSTLTTACAVDAWGYAHAFSRAHWGGQQSFDGLLDAAIGHAENGFAVTPSQAHWLDFRHGETAGWPGFEALFRPGGAAPPPGTRFFQPHLAESLKAIARHGPREFYEGALARRIAAGLAAAGSPLSEADIKATATREAAPLRLDYRSLTLLAPPPPTQGVTTLMIMGVWAALERSGVEEGSANYFHAAIEAVKQAFLDRDGVGDPEFAPQPVEKWLDRRRLAERAAAIDPRRALDWPQPFRTGDTVFFAATDSEGRGVSVLQSIYFDWGSGVVAGDTGILWQNRGAAFSLVPGHPSELKPGKRPFYTLNPGIALKAGRPHLLYGTQGADGQPQTLSLLLTRLIDHGLSPSETLRRPRFLLGRTFSDGRDTLKLEADVDAEVAAELGRRGHLISPIDALSPLAGQAGIIRIGEDGDLVGAHDPRGEGCALSL